jgi:hypothetical protein
MYGYQYRETETGTGKNILQRVSNDFNDVSKEIEMWLQGRQLIIA